MTRVWVLVPVKKHVKATQREQTTERPIAGSRGRRKSSCFRIQEKGLAQASQGWNTVGTGRRSTEPASTRGVRAQRRLSSGQRAPHVLHVARSVRGLLCRETRIYARGSSCRASSGQRAPRDLRLELKRRGELPTITASVYRVVGHPLAPSPFLLRRRYHARPRTTTSPQGR
ncbi:hypothetical protein HPB52_016890 [Rhipicephalus sanguineus]|uniref:Uncharacterized protein n=1 Tax=Rhipicephalus sanguineus TaxID=34632 RepID=A0A9D4T5T3_RHISA|nr:hypothetical protein HPB52_016890 [Rhipicephalus sanguineus]